MVKSVLQALPSYLFSCFLLPKHILKKMDQIVINFWWSGDATSRRIHWLSTNQLRNSVSDGGLGFRNFYDFNLSFVSKMAWRILTQPDDLWVQLLKGLYFPRSDFIHVGRHHKLSWIWSSIMEGRKVLLQVLRKNIGDGHGTSRIDAWIPEAEGFIAECSVPFSSNKVSDYILNPQRIWNVQKLHTVSPEVVVRQIQLIPLGPEGYSDRLIWHFESSGKYSVRSCYRLLLNNRVPNQPVDQSARKFWKWLWQLDLPPKTRFFVWRICRNAIPTKTRLVRKEMWKYSYLPYLQ
ncbi:Uncharacterized mitochondrial protein AtMg00310 [Linum perenne]